MTDRIFAYTVTLEREIRECDAQQITNAIMMIKGVMDVCPLVASPETYYARTRAIDEIRERLWDALYEPIGEGA